MDVDVDLVRSPDLVHGDPALDNDLHPICGFELSEGTRLRHITPET